MASLLKVAHSLSGGILDTTPADFGDPNIRLGYKTNRDGTIRPLTQEEKTIYDEHPMRRVINAWSVAMDVFGTPIATAGEGMINPLVSNDFRFDKPVSIRDEVSSIITAYTKAGPNSYRDNQSLLALIHRLNFPGAKTDSERITAFGQALHQVSGQVSPALNANDVTLVSIPTDTGFIWKAWNELEPEQKIGVYLADLTKIDPDTTQMLFTGWLRNAGNPGTEDIYNLDMFVGTAGFVRDDLLKSRISPLGVVQPRQYQNRTFQNGPTDSRLSIQLVNDGRSVSRRDLFNQALGISLSSYKVNTEQIDNTWTSPGEFEVIDGQTVRLGEVKSEDEFVLTTQLAATMNPNVGSYEYYKWWSNLIGKEPVSQEEFTTTVNNLTLDNTIRGPSVTLGTSGLVMRRADIPLSSPVRPPLFSIMSAIHGIDLTNSNVEIAVDYKGDMYYNIGGKRYLVESKPPLQPKTQFAANSVPDNERALFLYNRAKLEKQRALKRIAFALKKPEPTYTISQDRALQTNLEIKTTMDRWQRDYWIEAFSSENPWNWLQKNNFKDWSSKKAEQVRKTEYPGFVKLEEDIKAASEAILDFIGNGFKYVPPEKQLERSQYYIKLHSGQLNRARRRFEMQPKDTKSSYGEIWFNTAKEFLAPNPEQQAKKIQKLQETWKQTSDSYFETKLRSSWKPALEDPNSLKRSDFKTQQEWNEARQALRKRNAQAEREGY